MAILRKIMSRGLKVIFVIGVVIQLAIINVDILTTRLTMQEQLEETNNAIKIVANRQINTDISILAEVQDSQRRLDVVEKSEYNIDIEKLLNGSVQVSVIDGMGSGTVIKKTNDCMYILTCYHVIKSAVETSVFTPITVSYYINDKKNNISGIISYNTEVIKVNEKWDLAIIKVDAVDRNLSEIKISEKEPEVGDTVYSVGNPLGTIRTFSKGVLSNKIEGFYITDNTITFGNSGGSLCNQAGELIGVPARVQGYGYGEEFVPESGLGESINMARITEFVRGVI